MPFHSLVKLAARHRRLLWVLAGALTLGLGAGLPRLRIDTGLLGWLPQSHPNVQAFAKVFESLPRAVNQELVWIELDDDKAGALGVDAITDHESLLAMDELTQFVRDRVPRVAGEFGLVPWMRLLGSSIGDPTRASLLPATPLESALVLKALESASGELVSAVVSADRRGTVLSFILEVPPLSDEARVAGERLRAALEAYTHWTEKRLDLFRDEYLVPTGLPSGTALVDRFLRRDLLRLTPLAAIFVVLVLRGALGGWRAVALVVGMVGVGMVWTFGLMGWLDTPINVITISLVPMLIGCGINHALLVAMDAMDRRLAGVDAEETVELIGKSSALAITLTTLTTIAGLLTLCLSDSPGMAQLGLHAAVAMGSLAILSTLVLPGILVHVPFHRRSRFGPIIAPIATTIARNRTVVLIVYLIATGTAITLIRKPVFLLDVIDGNYPADDPATRAVGRMRERCGGSFPEIIIATGDLTADGAIAALGRVADACAASPGLGAKFRAVGVADLLGLRALLQKGSLLEAGFALSRARGNVRRFAPTEPDAVRTALRQLLDDERWAPLAGMFVSPQLDVSAVLLLGGDAGTSLESVGEVWSDLGAALSSSAAGGGPLELSFLGYRTMAYLFVTHSMEWLRITAGISFAVVLALTAIVLRERRAILVIAALMTTASVFWFATLQLANIHVSVFLLFPLVFAVCLGSDYALHILCRLRADRSEHPELASSDTLEWTHATWTTTGRAIAVAAATDGCVFLIYSRMDLVSASQVMLAVALAVASIFACTILLVPALMFPKRLFR